MKGGGVFCVVVGALESWVGLTFGANGFGSNMLFPEGARPVKFVDDELPGPPTFVPSKVGKMLLFAGVGCSNGLNLGAFDLGVSAASSTFAPMFEGKSGLLAGAGCEKGLKLEAAADVPAFTPLFEGKSVLFAGDGC